MPREKMILDNHGRIINYLRLAVTDRCNLRCFYCMPENGLEWLSRKEIMSYEELIFLSRLLVEMGIEKIRITGGEPFVRKDIMPFLFELSQIKKLKNISITTNGVLSAPYIKDLKKLGINSVNLSIDTLDRNRFFSITRRDELGSVLQTLEELLSSNMEVRLNTVVMDEKNIDDIIPIVQLTKTLPLSVRFIEEMPFNGGGYDGLTWNYSRIIDFIKQSFPEMYKIPDPPHSTSYNYSIPGHKGNVGVIAAFSRTFCGSCNRIRITPQGMLKTCLYDVGVLNVKDLIREGHSEPYLKAMISSSIQSKYKDGREAEQHIPSNGVFRESMATIGG